MAGEQFRKAREEAGLSLDEVARDLKIRTGFLSALENESFEGLPPDIYMRGFIREYAKYLGIPPEPLLEEYVKQRILLSAKSKQEQTSLGKGISLSRTLLIVPLIFALAMSTPLVKKSVEEVEKKMVKLLKGPTRPVH